MKKGNYLDFTDLFDPGVSLVLASCSSSTATSTVATTSTSTPATTTTSTVIPTTSTSVTATTHLLQSVTTSITTTTSTGNWWDNLPKPEYGGQLTYVDSTDISNFDPLNPGYLDSLIRQRSSRCT